MQNEIIVAILEKLSTLKVLILSIEKEHPETISHLKKHKSFIEEEFSLYLAYDFFGDKVFISKYNDMVPIESIKFNSTPPVFDMEHANQINDFCDTLVEEIEEFTKEKHHV